VERARSQIGLADYHLLFGQNCEHFAWWCTTGVTESVIQRAETVAKWAAGAAFTNVILFVASLLMHSAGRGK